MRRNQNKLTKNKGQTKKQPVVESESESDEDNRSLQSVEDESKDTPATFMREIEFNEFMQLFAIWFPEPGELKEIEIENKKVYVYVWHGINSKGQKVIVQVWRQNASVFAKFVE